MFLLAKAFNKSIAGAFCEMPAETTDLGRLKGTREQKKGLLKNGYIGTAINRSLHNIAAIS